jgi:hypothetical protein
MNSTVDPNKKIAQQVHKQGSKEVGDRASNTIEITDV